MDTLAHGLIGMMTYSAKVRERRRMFLLLALFFGMMPDLLSFGIYFVQRLATGSLFRSMGKMSHEGIPDYVYLNYNLTHSLLISLLFGVIFYCWFRPVFWPYLGWPIHILCDIPTHGRAFFPTPVFYPVWDWTFDGWSFGKYPGIIVGYYVAILIFYLILRFRGVEKKQEKE